MSFANGLSTVLYVMRDKIKRLEKEGKKKEAADVRESYRRIRKRYLESMLEGREY